MFKKMLSLLLAVMLVVSVMTVGVVTSSAATTEDFTPDPAKIYFDTDGTGWDMSLAKHKVAFYLAGGDFDTEANPTKPIAWGGSKLIGTATEGETGVFEFDPVAKLGYQLTPGVQYKLIFARIEGKNWKEQTYDLIFTTDCLGHVAYCDGTEYENPVDSSKKTQAAFWRDMDASEYGPVKQISSIGNVVGTCLEDGTTDESLFTDFLTVVDGTTGKTKYENAYQFVVTSGRKTEQQMIDDIGTSLGLAKQEIQAAFEAAEIETEWDYTASALHEHTPGEPVQENVVPATYKAGGSYDSVVYCSDPECGKEISRETITTDPAVLDPNKLYFDTDGTGWEMGTKNKVAFHIFGGDLENGLQWGASKSIGDATEGQPGVFEVDPANGKQGYTLNPGVQYKIIFVRTDGRNWKEQTYDLLFTTDCLGHVAYCDGTEYENPVDSSKKTLAAFWYDMDASEYGPVKQISSIGNVVGTCLAEGTTDESLFTDFLTVVDSTTNKTKYENAYQFVVEPGTKTDQKLIDDIGTDLGLTKQQVFDAFYNNNVETTWDYTVSTLPGEVTPPHIHTPGDPVIENDHASTCTTAGSYDEVIYCTGCNEEISRETKYHELAAHTPGTAVHENEVVTHDKTTYDEVVYCTVCHAQISRTPVELPIITHTLTFVPEVPATEQAAGTKAHYTCSGCTKLFSDAAGTIEVTAASLIIPKLDHVHTPGQTVIENEVAATCKAAGSYDEVVYCTSCHAELSRTHKTIAKLAHTPGTAVRENEVPATCKAAGSYDEVVYCTVCHDEISRTPKTIAKLAHTPGTAVRENEVPATCTAAGSYDEVVYCTSCHAELSRTPKTIAKLAHHIVYVPAQDATDKADGWSAHYKCNDCGKYFSDAQGKNELTWDQIVIPRIVIGKLGDVDGDGIITILDVTNIQRVLAGFKEMTPAIKKLGDVNEDGVFSITDATLLQRWLLGLNQDLNIGEDV